MANYYKTKTANSGTPQGFTGSTRRAAAPVVTVSAIFLPVYVCPQGVSTVTRPAAHSVDRPGCTAANGTLNPNNPFAAQGNQARLLALPHQPRDQHRTNDYRLTGGIDGTSVTAGTSTGGTSSSVELKTTNNGYIYLRGLGRGRPGHVQLRRSVAEHAGEDAIVFPTNHNPFESQVTQIRPRWTRTSSCCRAVTLNVAVTGSIATRRSTIRAPTRRTTLNPDKRYYGINAVGVAGKRHVWSAGYEVTLRSSTC